LIATSSEYKEKILEAREFLVGGTITLVDDTIITLSNSNVMGGGLTIEDATSEDGKFSIGSAIIGQCKITLDNSQDQFSAYDFVGAEVKPQVGIKLSTSNELFQKGVYTIDTAEIVGSTIVLTCLDNIDRLDTPFSGVTITFPCTTYQLLYTVCTYCGVSLGTSSFLNNDYSIEKRPTDDKITCREVVSWIAQIACSYVQCDKDGQLRLDWYDTTFLDSTIVDGGILEDYTTPTDILDGGDFGYTTTDIVDGGALSELSTFHHFYKLKSSNIATDDIFPKLLLVLFTSLFKFLNASLDFLVLLYILAKLLLTLLLVPINTPRVDCNCLAPFLTLSNSEVTRIFMLESAKTIPPYRIFYLKPTYVQAFFSSTLPYSWVYFQLSFPKMVYLDT